MLGPEPHGRLDGRLLHSPAHEGNRPSLNWEVLDNIDRDQATLFYVASPQGAHRICFDTPTPP